MLIIQSKTHGVLNIVINLVNGILPLKLVDAKEVNNLHLACKISLNVIGMELNDNNLLPVHNYPIKIYLAHQQNIQCGQLISNSTSCVQLDELPQCYFFKQNQCTPEQIAYKGSLCFRIISYNIVSKQINAINYNKLIAQNGKNTCQWDFANNYCVSQQRSNPTNYLTCTYATQNLIKQTIIPCQYVNGTCQSITSAKELNDQICSSKTLSTHYWIQAKQYWNMYSMYIQQNSQLISTQNQFSCSSYLRQQCQSSSYCSWSNGECNPLVCNQITDWLSCINNLECFWLYNRCEKFNGCLAAPYYYQCIGSSFTCMLYNQNNQCLQLSDNICSSLYNQTYCQDQLRYCYWNSNKCIQVEQCDQITQQRQYYRFGYTCIWQQGECQQLTCNKIQNEHVCTQFQD